MQKPATLMYLVLLLSLSLSCAETKSTEKAASKLDSVVTPDTLKFTSGIRAIFQDSRGNYWFGSQQEGVAVYDGTSFKYFTMQDGLTDNQIHAIQEDQAGLIWFDTQSGVSSYDGTSITNHTKASQANAQNSLSMPSDFEAPSAWMKAEHDLWFEGANKAGVYRYDGRRLHYLEFPPQKVLNPVNNLFAVTDMAPGKNNMIWFSTFAGVFGYNGRDFTIITDETLGYDRPMETLHIRSILEDSQGRLWIGNNGIGLLLKAGDAVLNFSDKQGLRHPNSKGDGDKSPPGTLEHVFVIAEDKAGNIWFGDRDAGIWKYDGETMANYTLADGLTNDWALSIYEDDADRLWFGMADGSIYIFNGTSFEKQF